MTEAPWSKPVDEVLKELDTSLETGLTPSVAASRLEKYGRNELDKEDPTPLWKLILEQFDDVLVKVLLMAAVVSFGLALTGDNEEEGIEAFVEPAVIMLILIINAIVGVWQESNAERALEALKEMQSEHAKTVRGGVSLPHLSAAELVPGDIVILSSGDRVPADMRLCHNKTGTVRAMQASLTGESDVVQKRPEIVSDVDAEIQSKEGMLFAGTALASGSCVGVVTATGMKTEMGKISGAISEAAAEVDDTPLKKKLDAFGVLLTQLIGIICVLVWLINYSHFLKIETSPRLKIEFSFSRCTYYFKIAVALAVAAIPEGLPTVITTCLALGTRKMVKRNAIVRKLTSVETLGCTTVICSDKTGTLTTNQMSCVRLAVSGATENSDLRVMALNGTSYDPSDGGLCGIESVDNGSRTTRSASAAATAKIAVFDVVADVCALCNEAELQLDPKHPERVVAIGMPTEAALLPLIEKLTAPGGRVDKKAVGFPCTETAKRRSKLERLAILEFDRNRKSMSVLVNDGSNRALYVKGAPESILDRAVAVLSSDGKPRKLTNKGRQAWTDAAADMASSALRCLALAVKHDLDSELKTYVPPDSGSNLNARSSKNKKNGNSILDNPNDYARLESGLCLVGLVGLQDPPRPEVPEAVSACRAAGIRVIVITGDNKLTAEAICRDIGVLSSDEDVQSHSITGRDFAALSKAQQRDFLFKHASGDLSGRVFSRAEPKHKQDIVRILKEAGEVTAMTGDGVNDAPALKLADIGLAMGIAGTEVAKEASDMILADDNFSTIVAAISEGRSIYNNMKAFIRYMISSNIGEVASIFFTAALGMPEGLIPVQLLWVNLVTDGPPATALGFNPPDADNMVKPPRRSDDVSLFVRLFFFNAKTKFITSFF
mmetsp:Transcript_18793/g.28342  ORF Transcript_18793/g.28342 Transcript_18793/m.28342 type:complete len:891 (+) Transcript_18793:75-2747(+)